MADTCSIPLVALALEAPCEVAAALRACRQAREFLAQAGLAEAELNGWELVLAEAANNAVKHCPPAARQLPLRLDLCAALDYVEVRVTDHTDGFAWPEHAALPPDESESGRGLFIIQNLTDESAYLRGPGENSLRLRKNRVNHQPVSPGLLRAIAESGTDELQRTLSLMTEELASSYESLSAIFRFSAELHAFPKLGDFARRWLNELRGIAEADWFVLRLLDEKTGELCVEVISSPALSPPPLRLEQLHSVEVRAAQQRSDVWFDASQPLAADDPLHSLAAASTGFAHPLYVNDTLLGILTLGRQARLPTFRAGQVNVAQTFGDFLALQIRSTQMQAEQLRSHLTARELEIAARIQQALLPTELPVAAHASFAGFYRSARSIGGDYYDALPTSDGNVLLVIADVMGKGLPAALFTFMFRSLVRARRDLASQPGKLLAWLNENLWDELSHAEMFMTAQIAYLDFQRDEIRLAGAGHPPLLMTGLHEEVIELAGDGLPLGIELACGFPEVCHPFKTGHALLFTDGLIEARNPAGDLLGFAPVKSALLAATHARESADAARARLAGLLQSFEDTTPPADDTSFLLIARPG